MELKANDVLRHKQFTDVLIKLVAAKGNGFLFESTSHGVKGLWSSRYISNDFDLIDQTVKE